jgi:NodT family efflux transporter outer membrane factor (OMF) lipoprotein
MKACAIAATAALLTLAGCMVGPDFKRPDPPKEESVLPPEERIVETVASNDVLGGEAQRFVADLDIPAQWWQVYRSRPLDDLVARSLKANPDIRSAVMALKVARQAAAAQRAALFPTVTGSGSGTHNEVSNVLSSPTATGNTAFGLFQALINLSYVLDIWGGTRRSAESLDAQAEAQCFALETAYLTLASNVVVTAITEASLRGQIAAAERAITLQRDTLALLQRRFAIGQAAQADVAQQQAALAQSEAALPPLQNQLSQQRHLLAQLTGQTTAYVPPETFELADLALPQDLPATLPSRMVEQRPDVRAAEASVHAAAAGVGVAISNMLPQFTISGFFGSTALSSDQLFNPLNGDTFTGGLGIVVPLLDGGALLARKRGAEAAWEQSKAQYRSTVLSAFRNVADAMRQVQFDAATLKAAAAAEAAARTSLEITRRRLAAGDAGTLEVLNAELTYQSAQLAQVQAQAARYADTAALFQALGGGWWNRDENGPAPAKRPVCKPPAEGPAARAPGAEIRR